VDRNKALAIVLSLAVYSLWLFYEASRERPETDLDATQHPPQATAPEITQKDDARHKAAPTRAPVPESPKVAHAESPEPIREISAWEGEFTGQTYAARLTNRGAALSAWQLTEFWELDEAGKRGAPVQLVSVDAEYPATLEMPFEDLGFGDLSRANYEVESVSADEAIFRLERGGVEIRKSYRFDPDAYGFDLVVEVRNGSDHMIAPDFAIRWPSVVRGGNDYSEQSLVTLQRDEVEKELVGGVGEPGFFSGLFGGGDDEPVVWREIQWAGVDLKYFASLLMPEKVAGTRADFEALEPGVAAAAVLRFEPLDIAPGQVRSQRFTAFLGPKETKLLESVGRQSSRTIDLGYSWFEPLTRFFLWLLETCYQFVPNYGWSIILITILVRIAMLPIVNKQMRSMEKMRALQPRMKEVQAQFADDRQKQSEATMALYREEGVNPLGGCLPMLLQMPVFIGLFFALQSSFALRQAPFTLWINDLSAPDVLFVVPGSTFRFVYCR